MEDAELEMLRRKKMQELQQQQGQAAMAQEQERQYEAQKQALMRRILTPEARERLGNLRMAKPELVDEGERQLIALAQSGRLPLPLDDESMRQILSRLTPQSREIKITRR